MTNIYLWIIFALHFVCLCVPLNETESEQITKQNLLPICVMLSRREKQTAITSIIQCLPHTLH